MNLRSKVEATKTIKDLELIRIDLMTKTLSLMTAWTMKFYEEDEAQWA